MDVLPWVFVQDDVREARVCDAGKKHERTAEKGTHKNKKIKKKKTRQA